MKTNVRKEPAIKKDVFSDSIKLQNIESIFNVEIVSDLPETLTKQLLSYTSGRHGTSKLLQLFALKSNLTTNEILVGYYRVFNEIKKRATIVSGLHYFVRKGCLKRVDTSTYALVESSGEN